MTKKTSDLFKLLFVLNRPKAILAGTTLTIKVEEFFCLVRMYFLKFYEFHFFVKKLASFCKFDVPKMLLLYLKKFHAQGETQFAYDQSEQILYGLMSRLCPIKALKRLRFHVLSSSLKNEFLFKHAIGSSEINFGQ